jgi:hydrogenase maturation protease
VTRHTRVIGLGNTLLTDDGVGVYAAREIRRRLDGQFPDVDIVESEVAGFALLELMAGWERVILIDAVAFDGIEPGEVFRIHPQDLRTSLRIRSVHEIDLPTALELGRRLGMSMPDEVLIFAVQAQDCRTFGERLNEPVQAACARAVDMVIEEIGLSTPSQEVCDQLSTPPQPSPQAGRERQCNVFQKLSPRLRGDYGGSSGSTDPVTRESECTRSR